MRLTDNYMNVSDRIKLSLTEHPHTQLKELIRLTERVKRKIDS